MGDFATVSTLPKGTLLHDRYEIQRVIGQGGVGIVYLAHDTELENEPRAIKTIRPELLLDPRGARLIRDEAIAAQRLAHPHIVRYYHYDECDGLSYIVLEYVEGYTLAELLAGQDKLDVEEFLPIACHLCEALEYAHEQGVIHQDIKPSNIFLDAKSRTKLADFGIARVAKDATTRLTGRMPPGTLLYMSPETLRGELPTAASDIYSLSIVFYEMLSGEPPFVRGDIFRQHQEYNPRPIAKVPDRLNESILKGLAKDSSHRPASAIEFWMAISGEPGSAYHEGAAAKESCCDECGPETGRGSFEQRMGEFGERMERWGEDFGERIEKKANDWSRKFEEDRKDSSAKQTPFGSADESAGTAESFKREKARWNKLQGGTFLIIIGLIFILQRIGGWIGRIFNWATIWPLFIIVFGIFHFLKQKPKKKT